MNPYSLPWNIFMSARFGVALILAATLSACTETPSSRTQQQMLHVPSPAREDQVVYFIITDLFNDGNPRNNDQGQGEYRHGAKYHFNGGDLEGILSGTSVYVTTWADTPLALRELGTEAQEWSFGSGTSSDIKIMDDTPPLGLNY